jgi:predicted phosphodiesterase
MVEVIYHIADIHIPNNISRHEEYNEVFKEVYKKLKEDNKEKLIVICGDLFHDKTMIKPEALSLAKDFIFNLCMYSEVIIIDGNHDINITNDSRMSTIEAMINHIKSNNKIHYLKENKIYKIKGINFGLTTMYSDEVTKIENKNKEERYIGLYHGTLYKSKTDNDYEFLDEKILKSKDFKDYDITLLGDIHKYQYLNKKKTIAYASSLIQQNFGEEEGNHGMLRWDVKTLGSEFIEIKNNYVYKTINIEDASNYEIEGIENKRTRLRIRYNSIDRDKIRKYESQIKKRYNIISITSEENYEVLKDIKEIEEDILNKKIMDVYYE